MTKKIILITGVSSGIGYETMNLLSKDKNNLILGIYNSTKVKVSKKNIKLFKCDIRDQIEISKVVEQIHKQFKRIDILINNSGIGLIKLLKDTSLDEWEEIFKINVTGMFLVTREVIRNRSKKSFLHIINVSSEAGIEGFATYSAYCSSKFAVVGFSKSIKEELKYENVKVNYICPGDVLTPFMRKCPIDKELMKKYDIEVLENRYFLKPIQVARQIKNIMEIDKNEVIDDIKLIPTDMFK